MNLPMILQALPLSLMGYPHLRQLWGKQWVRHALNAHIYHPNDEDLSSGTPDGEMRAPG